MKAFDVIAINIYGLHHSVSQWQRPFDFLPDRFDPSHPLSKTPSGEKRHAMSWLPFNGGKRVCFGKTFVEYVLNVTTIMMAKRFNIEFIEKGKYDQSTLPRLIIGQSHFPKLPVRLTKA